MALNSLNVLSEEGAMMIYSRWMGDYPAYDRRRGMIMILLWP